VFLNFSAFGLEAYFIINRQLIFIFSTHVFDVGDLVMIDDQVFFTDCSCFRASIHLSPGAFCKRIWFVFHNVQTSGWAGDYRP